MSKTKTPSQLETEAKKKANKQSSAYLQGNKKNDFVNWLFKKYQYGKFELNQSEQDILKSLDRIKKIDRVAGFRVFQFIQTLQAGNRSFFLVLNGFGGSIRIYKNFNDWLNKK
jgi:hypothetical protein